MYQRILVATDGSDLSQRAVQHALQLAQLSQAQLVVVKVVPHDPRNHLDGGNTLDAATLAHIETTWRNQALALLQAIQAQGREMGVPVQPVVLASDGVAESILTAATQHAADVIVMASHGRKGLQRLLLGSETQHVLAHAKVPVLVLR